MRTCSLQSLLDDQALRWCAVTQHAIWYPLGLALAVVTVSQPSTRSSGAPWSCPCLLASSKGAACRRDAPFGSVSLVPVSLPRRGDARAKGAGASSPCSPERSRTALVLQRPVWENTFSRATLYRSLVCLSRAHREGRVSCQNRWSTVFLPLRRRWRPLVAAPAMFIRLLSERRRESHPI